MGDFGVLGELPTVDTVKERINSSFDNLFHYDKDGARCAFVCTFCDEYLMCAQDRNFVPIGDIRNKRHLFEWTSYITDASELLSLQALVDAYTFVDKDDRVRPTNLLQGVCLSPRGVIGRKSNSNKSKWGFSCCNPCKNAISKNSVPYYAIINKNYVGHAPACLLDLTEVELSFITPVKGYGYCFSWSGGAQKVLKGSLTFMRVKERSIVRASAQLQGMGLSNHIVILLSGKMTHVQRQRAKQTVRVEKILEAVKWLCCNHVRWKEIDYDSYVKELENYVPTVIDHSNEVSSENQNIEKEEMFSCYYPDGAVNERQGGFNNAADFRSYIDSMQQTGYEVSMQIELGKEFVNGRDGDQLISSCLLQFPYGIGGLNEERTLKDGSLSEEAKLEPFLGHLSLISQAVFQYPMFQLVTYSLVSKLRLLRRSRFQLRDEQSASALASGVLAADVRRTARARQAGDRTAGTVASRTLLDGVDGLSRGLPHTNEAASAGRARGESMQHLFGIPTVFLTVTFDDENSLLMQVLSGFQIDGDEHICDLSDEQLGNRATLRKELRLNHPGLGALNFEMLFQIVMEDVVGWDMRRNCATDVAGLFGKCQAVTVAMEEQGRLTVHAHLCIWVEGFSELRQQLFFGSFHSMRHAGRLVPDFCEHICTTELIGLPRKRDLIKAFDHDCSVTHDVRPIPSIVEEQGLRDLRHRLGYKEDSSFASCSKCMKVYTYEDLVGLFCERIGGIKDFVSVTHQEPDVPVSIPKCRMHALCVEFQKDKDATVKSTPTLAIHAAYNSHASCHVTGCFKCQKKKNKKKHVCGATSDCECRFRMPDRARKQSFIRYVKEDNVWFQWNGVEKQQPIIEVLPKRHSYDLFQNVSCKAISESKFTCNSNVSIITDGPVGQYQFKYQMKSTQDDDTAAYSLVEHSIKSLASRVHEDDGKEAARLICRAAFAHNKGNVIGPSLASYLTRHDSRFYFSHDFQFCPLRDLKKALNDEKISGTLVYSTNGRFFENQALHYLCRPKELESLSPRQFYEEYYVLQMRGKPKKGQLRFIVTPSFTHPSAIKVRDTFGPCRQGVGARDKPLGIKVSQWLFKDTARFMGNNVLTCANSEMNAAMEDYAEWILLLFHSYRQKEDLKPLHPWTSYPHIVKLRELNAVDFSLDHAGDAKRVFTDRNVDFLQNIQNCAHNSMRYKLNTDDLQSVTIPFKPSELPTLDEGEVGVEEEEEYVEIPYHLFLQHCDDDDVDDTDPTLLLGKLQKFSFKPIRNNGTNRCGNHEHIPEIELCEVTANDGINDWVYHDSSRPARNTASIMDGSAPRWKIRDIVTVLLKRSIQSARPQIFKGNVTAKVTAATGSFESIHEWACAAMLDARQKRCFESIIAAFLLTFHDFSQDDYNDAQLDPVIRTRARNAKKQLLFLKGGNGSQLIMLLHGPGGSGKSRVISLVIDYAQEYCSILGHPYTIRTIVVTAMSGVAATLIHGETTHMSMGLNKPKPTDDMIEAWADTRLVIIDECSFASERDFNKMEENARLLKNVAFQYYGGLNVVFAGDFSQLEPPRKTPIYDGKDCPAFHGLLNAFIELDGQHRFKNDPTYGHMMLRFRNGVPTAGDITLINETCCISSTRVPPPNVPVAVYKNRNRDAINCAQFERFCERNHPTESLEVFDGAILIFMDNMEMRDYKNTYVRVMSNSVKSYFFRNCGEHACKTGDMTTGRVDPVLKLYHGCPMMLTENKDVPSGQANGSRLKLKSVKVKMGEQPMIVSLLSGVRIRAFSATQIASLTLRHEVEDIKPQEFEVVSKSFTFSAIVNLSDDKRALHMKGNQFPIVSNGVTTGHKLQGCSMEMLAVFEQFYGQNWMYVILSRVRTMQGLYLAHSLDSDLKKYAMSVSMQKMIATFAERIGLTLYTEDVYSRELQRDRSNREDRGTMN